MDDNLKKYIDSLFDQAEATAVCPGSAWNADHETLATAYRLCKDNNYFPERFSTLCWNYRSMLSIPGSDYEADKKSLELATLGLEHCPEDDDISRCFLNITVKNIQSKSEEKAGIDSRAAGRIKGISKVLALNLDLTDVLIRGFGWVDEDYGYRKQIYYYVKTKIRAIDSRDSYMIEWRFSGHDAEASLDRLSPDDQKHNLLITENGGLVRFRLFPDNPGSGPKYTVDILCCPDIAGIEKVATFGNQESGIPVGDDELLMLIKRLSDGLKAGTLPEARFLQWDDVIESLKNGRDLHQQMYECEYCKGKVYAAGCYYFKDKLFGKVSSKNGELFICHDCLEQLSFQHIHLVR